jgi:hypothetical protein
MSPIFICQWDEKYTEKGQKQFLVIFVTLECFFQSCGAITINITAKTNVQIQSVFLTTISL